MPGANRIPDSLIETLTPFFERRMASQYARITTYSDSDTVAQDTAGATWASSTISISVTLPSAGWVLAVAIFQGKTAAGTTGRYRIYEDTNIMSQLNTTTNDAYETRLVTGLKYLAAGTYSIILKYSNADGGSNKVYIDDAYMVALTWED